VRLGEASLAPLVCSLVYSKLNKNHEDMRLIINILEYVSLHKERIVRIIIPLICFLVGLALPSPFFHGIVKRIVGETTGIELSDTTSMRLADESVYDGSIIKDTKTRHGFGRLTTKDGSVYEGDWKNDRLPYGKRTTASSVYTGKFDEELNNSGFGIVTYSQAYIDSKRKQGMTDSEIVVKYIGNWSSNSKNGLGRTVNADGSMTLGEYVDGVFQKVDGANYRIGGSVYGIDLSHHQMDVD